MRVGRITKSDGRCDGAAAVRIVNPLVLGQECLELSLRPLRKGQGLGATSMGVESL